MRSTTWGLLLVLTLAASSASARDEVDVDGLAKLAKANPKKGLIAFEKALAAARKGSDLKLIQELAPVGYSLVPKRAGRADPAALIPRLKKTGGTKSHSHFSAHQLAYAALRDATHQGDQEGVEPAIALALKRGATKFGAYGRAMAAYATGLKAMTEKTYPKAVQAFATVLAAATANNWSELALDCGIELTLARLAAGEAEAAKRTLAETLAAVPEDVDISMLHTARTVASRRLRPGHVEFELAWVKALSGRIEKYGRNTPAGAGGAGRTPGLTPIGRVLKKAKRAQRLVVVTRRGTTFHVEYAFGDLPDAEHRRTAGVQQLDRGGLVLSFWETGVRLEYVSPQNEAVPGVSGAPQPWQHFEHLADKESWTLMSTGETRIK